jgi:glycosyltransferase involved in cell wall biosynthesis
MEKRNFPAEKLSYLNWDIKCYSEFTRGYSAKGIPLRIGYAGRVTIRQKRLDRVFGVADALKKLGVAFRLQIAGKGDYFDTLRTAVKENGLQVEVELVGYVKNDDIQEFWIRQDIMLSCSEYEGHSITQMEAMASGAVPIVMDVSGADDDIEDDVNGFIVTQGKIDEIVDRMCRLDEDRELLRVMGRNAHETIREKMIDQNKGVSCFESLILNI